MNELVRAGVIARVELGHEPDFALGPIQVRPSRREIMAAGTHEIIEPRVMQVLVALVRAKGDILTRDDLIESCWDGVIVGEDALQRCISRLRKLAEANGNAFAIETIPRVGYRLKVAKTDAVPPLRSTDARKGQPFSACAAAAVSLPFPTTAEPRRLVRLKWRIVVSAVGVLVLLTVGLMLWQFWPSKPPSILAAPVEASVAVLPFVNMSGDPKQEYFSDGFSEELINDLTNVPHLNVASRTSSFAFKGKNEDIGTIARALGVHAIVEGSVREVGDRVRITAQLIDSSNGYHLWSADYTRNLTDILSLQDELARSIAAALTHRLVPAPTAPRPKIDPAVYRLYLEGRHQWRYTGPPQDARRALAIFRQVTIRAPDFADGFAYLSIVADYLAYISDAAPASDFALASAAAQHALSLDPRNMLARSVRGYVALGAWNWRAAASDFRILRDQNPNSIITPNALRAFYEQLGFPDEALAQWRHLSASDPSTYRNVITTLFALDWAGRFQEEIGVVQAQLVRSPRDTIRMAYLCSAYAATGQIAQARAAEERLRRLQTDFESRTFLRDCEFYIDVATGNRAGALKLLHISEAAYPDRLVFGPRLSGVSAACFGASYVLLGDFDKATGWFERAYERREPILFGYLYGFGNDMAMEKYRLTPGYKALAAKPLFKDWQAEHDRIAAALAAHREPLN